MRIGIIQERILLLLAAGLALGLAYTPRQRYKVFRGVSKEWETINNDTLRRAIQSLYKNKMIDLKEQKDGSMTMILLNNGKKRILEYKLEDMKIRKPKNWDKKWRMVLFDIPKNMNKVREAFRSHLKRLGFYQYQKSVFVYPYECQNEIDFLIEFYKARPYIRQLIVLNLDNQFHLEKIFKNL